MVRHSLALTLVIGLAMSSCGGNTTGTKTTAASPTAVATAATPAEPLHLVLDTAPRPQPPEVTRRLGPPPPSTFPPWDGKSTVIYDTQTGKALDLGPGSGPASFSPDDTKAVWAAGGEFANGTEVFVVDLPSGQRRSLGAGRSAQFIDNQSIVVFAPGSNERTVVDVVTGARRPYAGEPVGPTLSPPPSAPEGYLVEPENPNRLSDVRTFTVRDARSSAALLTFDAASVVAAGKGELAAAAPPVNGRSNVYFIDIRTGKQTYVASALSGVGNWPFSATADAILWTDGYCGPTPGPATLFDRKTGQLVRFDTSGPPGVSRWMLLTPGGLLAPGMFGAEYLINPSTLAYVAVIPSRPDGYSGDVSWSASYRYASHGPYGGHGGICGPG